MPLEIFFNSSSFRRIFSSSIRLTPLQKKSNWTKSCKKITCLACQPPCLIPHPAGSPPPRHHHPHHLHLPHHQVTQFVFFSAPCRPERCSFISEMTVVKFEYWNTTDEISAHCPTLKQLFLLWWSLTGRGIHSLLDDYQLWRWVSFWCEFFGGRPTLPLWWWLWWW